MSNIDKQALRERYSEKPAPKCHICGAVMSIQAAGAGGVTYGCTGRIDKDGEGYKFAEGRHFADDHYARSRVTDYSPSGDPEVLALLDELEKAQAQSSKWCEAFHKAVSVGARYEERIAVLEAMREVFLRAKALMYQSGGSPIENSLNPIDAWLYDAERAAAGIGKGE